MITLVARKIFTFHSSKFSIILHIHVISFSYYMLPKRLRVGLVLNFRVCNQMYIEAPYQTDPTPNFKFKDILILKFSQYIYFPVFGTYGFHFRDNESLICNSVFIG